MASVAPAACSFWAMPQAMERLFASPKTTAVLPAKSIMLVLFLEGPREERRSCWRYQSLGYQSALGASRLDRRARRCQRDGPESGSRGVQIFLRSRWQI